MKAKLQRAKRTLDNMKKREAEAIAARDAALAQLASAGEGAGQVKAKALFLALYMPSLKA